MYRVEFFCPRQSPNWQILTEGLIFKTPVQFSNQQAAEDRCYKLIWQYHSARVIDPYGQIVYQI